MHLKEELDRAVARERNAWAKRDLIAAHKRAAETPVVRNVKPGPGEYDVDRSIRGAGGAAWGRQHVKGFIEQVTYEKKGIPSPSEYVPKLQRSASCARISTSNAKSDVEWQPV